ncbi:MAG: DoxX family membrane protein [Candidatus Eisenbacteria bacterium]|uniref:DoxX family membrane protein n=1 Tax=Eiseniibacteriota bacterium TaxID=2212470 RepID=A0A933SIX0_UNCEI|nr:DoxX family membrane protein [Candidatus Eisenbacteria bacterium]
MNVTRTAGTLAQFALGVLFLAAALAKLGDLGDFANQVNHYRLAPVAWVNLIAMVTPWIELLAGLSLVLRVKPRAGALVALVLLVVFTAAVASAWARGLDFRCGCFGKAGAQSIGARKFVENAALTLLAVGAFTRRDD